MQDKGKERKGGVPPRLKKRRKKKAAWRYHKERKGKVKHKSGAL